MDANRSKIHVSVMVSPHFELGVLSFRVVWCAPLGHKNAVERSSDRYQAQGKYTLVLADTWLKPDSTWSLLERGRCKRGPEATRLYAC